MTLGLAPLPKTLFSVFLCLFYFSESFDSRLLLQDQHFSFEWCICLLFSNGNILSHRCKIQNFRVTVGHFIVHNIRPRYSITEWYPHLIRADSPGYVLVGFSVSQCVPPYGAVNYTFGRSVFRSIQVLALSFLAVSLLGRAFYIGNDLSVFGGYRAWTRRLTLSTTHLAAFVIIFVRSSPYYL